MEYVAPKLITKSMVVSDRTFSVDYYAPPSSMTGVVDESYPEYSAATTYNDGTFVKLDALKKVYRCAANNTTGKHPLLYPDEWVDYGSLNSYKMLSCDEHITAQTVGTDVMLEIDFSRSDSFAFVASDFSTVRIELIDNTTSEVKLDKTYVGRDYGCLSYSEYYFTDYKVLSRLVVTGFEYMPDATLRLSFDGETKIGGIVYGIKSSLGATLYGTSLKLEDTSKVITSEVTGTRSVVRYGNVRVIECNVALDVADFNIIANKAEAIIGRNILWIPSDLDKFSELISIGYIERFDMPIENPTTLITKTTIIGVL